MAGVKIAQFGGVLPRMPASLLPEGAATAADNCNLAYGELRNARAGLSVGQMRNVPRSIYTDDGLTFYTWPADVDAVRSPIVNDPHQRLYYSGDGGMRVTSRMGTRLDGGAPGSSYLVGVPRPEAAPKLQVTLPKIDPATTKFEFSFHYEYGGVRYQEQAITPAMTGENKWQFTPPAMLKTTSHSSKANFPIEGVAGTYYLANDSSKVYQWNGTAYVELPGATGETPASAFPVLHITATSLSDGSQLFDLYVDNSAFASGGGVYGFSMAKDANADTYTATVVVSIKEADKETRAVVYTFVNTYDEEGPPSPPALVNTSPLMAVDVTATKTTTAGYAPIKEIRVYSTVAGSDIADYFYRGSIAVLTAPDGEHTLFDSSTPDQANEPLSSTGYYAPDPALVGLMELPNGILCAWKGNELHFSEAYRPWAWPPAYVKPLAATIVGGIAHGSGAVITTVKWPYLLAGVSPDAMTEEKLNVEQAGVSKWAIASVAGQVVYASNDGIVTVRGGQASLAAGQTFFTREVWRELFRGGLRSLVFVPHDGLLLGFSNTGTIKPFVLQLDEAGGAMSWLPSFQAQAAFVSVLDDHLYYARGATLYSMGDGADLAADWMSRELVLARPLNFAFAQAVVEGDWTVEVYAGGRLRHTRALAAGVTDFRLPAGFTSDRWMVRVRGIGRFRELRMAETARELATL